MQRNGFCARSIDLPAPADGVVLRGRAELWPAFHTAFDRLDPRPPQLPSILARLQ